MASAFPPLKADHWLVQRKGACPGCKQTFKAGDITTLVKVGPGNDPEEREKARHGRPYNAVALPAHYACVTGEVGYD